MNYYICKSLSLLVSTYLTKPSIDVTKNSRGLNSNRMNILQGLRIDAMVLQKLFNFICLCQN